MLKGGWVNTELVAVELAEVIAGTSGNDAPVDNGGSCARGAYGGCGCSLDCRSNSSNMGLSVDGTNPT